MTIEEFYLSVARGIVPNCTVMNKFGRNDDIDTAAQEDIWAGGGTRVFLSTAETMNVRSGDAADDGDPAGTGARTIRIFGLDSDYEMIDETVTLNGTSQVETVNEYLRVYRAYVETAGSQETNVGQITIDPSVSGSGSRQALISAGDGQTLISHYTIPAGYTGFLVGGKIAVGASTTGVKEANIKLWKMPLGGAWRLQENWTVRSDGSGIVGDVSHKIPSSFAEKTDLKWTATVDNNNTTVYVQYSLILVKN